MNEMTKTLLLILTASLWGCSTPPQKSVAQPAAAEVGASSSHSVVEISYTLAQNLYQLHFEDLKEREATQKMNHKQTHVASMDEEAFRKFTQTVQHFIALPQRGPAQVGICRTPYSVTLITGGASQTVSGCRSEDGAAFSKLIRDGEHFFLVKSK